MLHYACQDDWGDTVQELIRKGANVDAQCVSGNTPAHYVVQCNGNWDLLKYLFKAGANANLENNDGDTALTDYIFVVPIYQVLRYFLKMVHLFSLKIIMYAKTMLI